MSQFITGLSYASWERDSELLEVAASKSERTGLLDAWHLNQASAMETSIIDELMMVDDLRELSDPETAAALEDVRTRLAAIQERVHIARRRMGQLQRPDLVD